MWTALYIPVEGLQHMPTVVKTGSLRMLPLMAAGLRFYAHARSFCPRLTACVGFWARMLTKCSNSGPVKHMHSCTAALAPSIKMTFRMF